MENAALLNPCARRRGSVLSVFALVSLLSAIAVATPSAAQVIEVGSDGDRVVYDRPAVFTSDGVSPIATSQPPTEAPRRAPPAVAASLTRAGGEVALSPLLLEAVAWAESRFRQEALSPDGAQGVMQLMPETAAELGVNAADAEQNVRGGARYLRQMLQMFDGDIELALAAYNAGPGAVQRYNGVPPYPETRAYVAAILDHMAAHAIQEQSP